MMAGVVHNTPRVVNEAAARLDSMRLVGQWDGSDEDFIRIFFFIRKFFFIQKLFFIRVVDFHPTDKHEN